MKSLINCLLIVIFFLGSCSKKEDSKTEEPKTTINGEVFSPTNISAKKINKSLVLTFTEGSKKVEITTNDTIAGTYTISSEMLKSSSVFKASIVYTNGTTEYYGQSGTVVISKNSSGSITGTYEAYVVSEGNSSIQISGGVFSGLLPIKIYTLITTIAALNDSLVSYYTYFNRLMEFNYLLDAVYSHTITPPSTSWNNLYAHSQNPLDSKVLELWDNSYSLIAKSNLTLKSAENMDANESELMVIISQAKVMRAYAYSNLLNWFGAVPIESSPTDINLPRNTVEEVSNFVKYDLIEASANLPNSWAAGEKFKAGKYFAKGLLARAYISNNNLEDAKNIIGDIINSGQFALGLDTMNFAENNAEIMLGFTKGTNTEFNNFFTKSSYVPAMRLSEVHLLSAEALYNLNDAIGALQNINMLRVRRNKPMLTELTKAMLLQQYKTELIQEGTSFATLKRMGFAISELQIAGYKLLLPIPQLILDTNPNITQNPGY